jgi:hypothetical protein
VSSFDGPNAADDPPWRRALEGVQNLGARAARRLSALAEPPVDLGPAAGRLAEAIAATHAAMDDRSDRLADLRRAAVALDEAAAALALGAAHHAGVSEVRALVGQVRASLEAPERELGRLPAALPREPSPLRASRERPSLHDLGRPSLRPHIRVPAPPPPLLPELAPLAPPKNVAELGDVMRLVSERAEQRRRERAERAAAREQARTRGTSPAAVTQVPPGFVAPIDPPPTASELVGRRMRELFEEVAMIGTQREPQLGDAWASLDFLDKRMLTSIDAIAALGHQALGGIEELVVDSPVTDPARAFAAVMILGCFRGRDALAAAERVVRHLGVTDPLVARCAGDALKLVPHPDLGLALRTLLDDPDEGWRALALEVLSHRGLATVAELVRMAHDPAPSVAAVALVGLASLAPAHAELPQLLAHAAGRPELCAASWLAMALSNHVQAIQAPMAALRGELGADAAMALALSADETAAARLTALTAEAPSLARTSALGWVGSPGSIPLLVALLTSEDADIVLAAAQALDRITGAQLYEQVQIAPEQVIVPDVAVPSLGDEPPAPLAATVSDPRDRPAEGSPDTVMRPTTDPGRWQSYWRQRERSYEPRARYRRGHPFTPSVALWELVSWVLTTPERRRLQHELVVRTGRFVRFDPVDLVVAQQAALLEWEPIARAASSTPGGWARPSRRY